MASRHLIGMSVLDTKVLPGDEFSGVIFVKIIKHILSKQSLNFFSPLVRSEHLGVWRQSQGWVPLNKP